MKDIIEDIFTVNIVGECRTPRFVSNDSMTFLILTHIYKVVQI